MRLFIIASFAVLLTGCGVAYNSPQVTAGPQVAIVPITPQSIAAANSSIYQPRSLPEAFSTTAGAGEGGSLGAATAPLTLPAPIARNLRTHIPPAIDHGPYKIGVGDILQMATPVSGSGVEELAGLLAAQNSRQGYTVQDDGAINIPDVGRVNVAGLTLQDAESALFQRLAQSQLSPTFSLEIAEFKARRVAIGGAVAAPTLVPITLTPLYLGEALAVAGGTALANPKDGALRLYRDDTLYQITLADLQADAALQRLRLIDGDSIYVDAGSDLALAQAYFEQQIGQAQIQQQARDVALRKLTAEVALRRAELAEQRETFAARAAVGAVARDYAYLFGEIGVQARYPLPYQQRATLADALFDAGNGVPLETGDVSQIYVLRALETGEVTAWQLDGRQATNLTLATRFELRPNDIIFVSEQPVTRWGRVLSQLTASSLSSSLTRSLD